MPKKSAKTVLPDPLPNGEVLEDIAKKKWCLGPSIGVGGFGEIYSAAEYTGGPKKSLNYQYVVKIEPHGNGPLFCEMHFFMRNAKPDMIQAWCSEKKIKTLGMPRYLGSGSHEHNGKKYRFLVMDKYGRDLWHLFLENRKQFPASTVYRIGLQILEVLEYIHSNGYIHADIKGANILVGLSKSQNQVFLVDFGLASHYTKKEFKPDPKKAHNGTIEYTSRDAHEGVPTRRGDIEILSYNLIHWMGCTLPWEKNLNDPVAVHNSKKENMANVSLFLKNCFSSKKVPDALLKFMEYVNKMKYDTEPDYKKLQSILLNGLKQSRGSLSGSLDFKALKRKSEETDNSETPEKKTKVSPVKRGKKGTTDENNPDINLKSRRTKKKQEPDSEELEEEEEKQPPKLSRTRKAAPKKTTVKEPEGNSSNGGYTAEMLRLQQKIAERKAGSGKRGKANGSSASSEMGTRTNSLESLGDVVDGTPPEKLAPKRKRRINTPMLNGDSDVTSRILRQRK